MTKKVSAVFLLLAVAMVLFFTFQDAEGTTRLSEAVRTWLEGHGLKTESHALRSNIHILEYLVVGFAVLAFGASQDWKITTSLLVCGAIALLDETLKIWLPTREFDVVDLVKDFVGIGIAIVAKSFLNNMAKER